MAKKKTATKKSKAQTLIPVIIAALRICAISGIRGRDLKQSDKLELDRLLKQMKD